MEMEAWLSELEMEWNNNNGEDMGLNNDIYFHQYHQSQQEDLDTFNEELALILGENFPSPLPSNNNNNINMNNLYRSPSIEQLSPLVHDPNVDNNNPIHVPQKGQNVSPDYQNGKDPKQQDANGKRKRKREPSQIYDHIMAERKRRELLARLFIALSALVPGLKKVDKTSILGEAIKYLQQLQEKVKGLEEAMAKQNVESVVVVKRAQLVLDDGEDNDDDSTCTVDNDCGRSAAGRGGHKDDSLPDIEVKVSNKTVLIRLYCEKRKGMSGKIFAELEKHDLTIVNSSIASFGNSAFNFTIVAQTEKMEKKHVKKLVINLHRILRE